MGAPNKPNDKKCAQSPLHVLDAKIHRYRKRNAPQNAGPLPPTIGFGDFASKKVP